MSNLFTELEGLIKRASDKKTKELEKAAGVSQELDSTEDGTRNAETGEMAADHQRAQKETYADNMVDTDARDNKAGGSVDNSTEKATATATDGQEGAKGALLDVDKKADNGPTLGDTPKPDGWNSGAFKGAEDLRAQAAELRKTAGELSAAADNLLTPMDKFLVKAARANPNAKLKKVAQEMPDDELAGSAADGLLEQLESGNLSDDEAAAILEEAMAEGAISEEDIAEAAAELQAAGAAEGEMPPEGELPLEAPEGGPVTEDQLMEAKLAAADVGPGDERYLEKLAAFYPDDINAGYDFAMKLAQALAAEEEALPPALAEEVPPEEEVPGEEVPPEEVPMGMDMIAPEGDEEAAALAAIQEELGLTDEQLAELMAAPVEGGEEGLGKVAKTLKTAGVDYKTRARTTILNKVAAVRQ